MPEFVFTAMDIHSDGAGAPCAWSTTYTAANFNTAGPRIPGMGELLGKVHEAGARTMLVDGMTIRYAGVLPGVTLAPALYGTPTSATQMYLEKKTTLSTTDAAQWDCYGWPISVTEALQKAFIGDVAAAGYAATDDMILTIWGRFA